MELWVGPVIIAASVSALVTAAGWFVSSWQAVRADQRRRNEKSHDFQVALRAEIKSDYFNLAVIEWEPYLGEVRERYAADQQYSVAVPHMASNAIFGWIVKEIHVLPSEVIGPVVDYARFRETVEQFVVDLRSDRFRQLPSDRQLLMYSDYVTMLERLEVLAGNALASLNKSLEPNSPAEDLPNQSSASAPAEARDEARGQDEP